MENNHERPTVGLGLGIAGLVLGIVAVIVAFFPCITFAGLVLGILGVALSTVGLTQAKKVNAPTNLLMAALIVSIIGTSIAAIHISQPLRRINRIPWEHIGNRINEIERNSDDFGRAFEEEFEKELGGDLEDVLRDLENELEDVGNELEDAGDQLERQFENLSDEEKARRLGRAAGRAVRGFVDELADSTNIDIDIDINTD